MWRFSRSRWPWPRWWVRPRWLADAVHSLSDSATSIILLIGFALAGQPADRKHPYGHQRMELITALIIAVLLVVAGVELIHLGIDRLRAPSAEAHVFSYRGRGDSHRHRGREALDGGLEPCPG